MTKAELVARISENRSMSRADANRALDAICKACADALVETGAVTLPGIGTLSVVERGERQGYSISERGLVTIPAHKAVKFSVSRLMKARVRG